VKWDLKEMGVEQIECLEEADRVLAQASAASVSKTNLCVVYGNDSDFALFDGSLYCPFDQLLCHSSGKSSLPFLVAKLVTRKAIASVLQCSEHSLLEWTFYQVVNRTPPIPFFAP
jgi:hypothetical protein